MARKRPVVSLPAISKQLPADARRFLERVNEALNAGIFATKEDLEDIKADLQNGLLGGGSDGTGDGGGDGEPPEDIIPDQPCGPTVYPSTPTGLEADGAFANIILTWDTAPYCGHGYTEVWASQVDNLGTADIIGQTTASVFAHPVGEGSAYYYWIRFVNRDGEIGPFNQTAGTLGETAPDIGYLLDLLTTDIASGALNRLLYAEPATEEGTEYLVKLVAGDEGESSSVGFGMNLENRDGLWTSDVRFMTDRFALVPPPVAQPTPPPDPYPHMVWADTSGGGEPTIRYRNADNDAWLTEPEVGYVPFTVLTAPQVIEGQRVEPGVYITDAFIKDAAITNAKIKNLAVDSAKISDLTADKITAGTLQVGVAIKSDKWDGGGRGFYLDSDGGFFEANDATIRGRIIAEDGQFLGTLLGGRATSFTSGTGLYGSGTNYRFRVGNPDGHRLEWDGSSINIYNGSTLTFSSGGLNWDQIGGKPVLGDLSEKDKADWASDIINKTGFAAAAVPIAAADITTYIDAAAIRAGFIETLVGNDAYINRLRVATLNIAGNAVTVPVGTSGVPPYNSDLVVGINVGVATSIYVMVGAQSITRDYAWTFETRAKIDGYTHHGYGATSVAEGYGGFAGCTAKIDVSAGNHVARLTTNGAANGFVMALAVQR